MAIRKVCSAVLLAWAVLLVSGTALGAPEAQTSQLFTELPPRHWSYNAVRSLSTAGLVREPPDGFGAGLTVTRLEMALEVGEAMDRLRAASQGVEAASLPVLVARYNRSAPTPLGSEQMRLLEALALEFSPELGALGYTVIPSPQSFRLEHPSPGQLVPELDAVWLGFGERTALTWSAASLGLEPRRPDAAAEKTGELEQLALVNPELSLGARIRLAPTVQVEGEVEPLGGRPGYRIGAGVDLGDVYISGGYDVPSTAALESDDPGQGSTLGNGRTRWGVRWTAGDAEVTAAYEYVGLDQLRVLGASDLASRVELGVGVAVEGGVVRVGWSREAQNLPPAAGAVPTAPSSGDQDEPSGEDEAPEEGATSPFRQVNTTLRLTYDLSSVASLTLGYQLIDFTGADGATFRDAATAEAMAEFTLRF